MTDDLPYADDDADSGDADDSAEEADDVIDLRDDKGDDEGDPLAAMVRDAVGKAVQGAMRRRPGGES